MPEPARGDVRYYQNELVLIAGPVIGNRVLVIYPDRKKLTVFLNGPDLKQYGFQSETTHRKLSVFAWDWLPVLDLEEEPFVVRMRGTAGKRAFVRG